MFYNYFKVGVRNILKYKVFSFINVFGLAVSMSVCMLIILMLVDQRKYDQFHLKKDRIYRILSKVPDSSRPHASTPFPLAAALKINYPTIEESTHLTRGVGGEAVYKNKRVEMRGFFADASFFKVFSFPLEKGNKSTVLQAPNSIVISRKIADQLFSDENPIGKTVEFFDRGLHYLKSGKDSPPVQWGYYTITGVIPNESYKSHLKFDVLMSSSSLPVLYKEKKMMDISKDWEIFDRTFTYVLLTPGKNEEDLSAALTDLVTRKDVEFKNLKGFQLREQSLTKITPGILVNQPTSFQLPIEAYYFLSFLALIIMGSACLNYGNLSTARAITRAKEIGIRKVTGAKRKDLVFQFLSESIITALFALLVAIVLIIFIKPAFKGLWVNTYLNFELQESVSVYIIFTGFALLIGILAGLYPAWYLAKCKPIQALKNNESKGSGSLLLRKVLSTAQFVVSLLFIITSILIYTQFKHFLEFEYGFNTKNVLNIELQGNSYQKISTALSTVPGVSSISASEYIPAIGRASGMDLKVMGSKEEYKNLELLSTDENFIHNLEIKLISGKNLPATNDSVNRFILVNEAAVKELGYQYPSEIIGQILETRFGKEALEVVGVVKDFYVRMPTGEDNIGPAMLRNQPANFSFTNVKIVSGDIPGTISRLEAKWESVAPNHSFKYRFYDEQLTDSYQVFYDAVSIIGFIAFLAVIIACLGLLGMATYTTERRMKEVSIRKVLGAKDLGIALLLSKGFLKILIVSVFIGGPLSYIINNFWLQDFPNRVDFGFGTILLGSLILLLLGLLTIGSQTLRAAMSKPIDTLRFD
ncbi:MAG TPA: ABC transporter permease [Cytophagales bacterium]|nr:ABC transporter permease [Cytophagales bacterium]